MGKMTAPMLAAAALAMLATGCGDDAPQTQPIDAVLTVVVEGAGQVRLDNGQVCEDRCQFDFNDGRRVSLDAEPSSDDGTAFGGWSGHCGGLDDCAVTMDKDRQVTAHFEGVCPEPWEESLVGAEVQDVSVGALVVVAGRFEGVLEVGDQRLESSGGADGFVAAFSRSQCALRWLVHVDGSGDDDVTALTLDASGNAYVSGRFDAGGALAGAALAEDSGARGIFLAKLAGPNGLPLWSRTIVGEDELAVGGVAVGDDRAVFWAGTFAQTVDFGDGLLSSREGGSDVFQGRFDSLDGRRLWTRRYGSEGSDRATGLAVTEDGDPVVSGDFAQAMPTVELEAQGQRDGFVMRISQRNGVPVWGTAVSVAEETFGGAVAVAANEILLSVQGEGQFAAVLEVEGGQERWRLGWGGGVSPTPPAVAFGQGRWWLGTALSDTAQVPDTHEPVGPSELVLLELDGGALVGAHLLGNDDVAQVRALSPQPDGALMVATQRGEDGVLVQGGW